MKREEILSLAVGRELDALVEEHVLGNKVKWVQDSSTDPYPISGECEYIIEHFSTEISAAWEVVEKIKTMLFSKRNRFLKEIQIMTKEDSDYCMAWPDVFWTITPERICKAALLAVSKEEKA